MQKEEILFSLMKQYGVSYFKNVEFEVRMNKESTKPIEPLKEKEPPHAAAAPPVNEEIPHHVNEVAKLLKLSDEELVDKLFPDYSQMTNLEGQ